MANLAGTETNANSQALGAQNQQFNQLGQVDTNAQNFYQSQYADLARLAGADIGSPATAAQIMQGNAAAASAYTQGLVQPLVNAAGTALTNWWDAPATTSAPGYGVGRDLSTYNATAAGGWGVE
jgi:hypothetical protein